MNRKPIRSLLTVIILGSCLAGGAAAEQSILDKAGETMDKAGQTISETSDKVGQQISEAGEKVGAATSRAGEHVDKFIDDSALTVKVKKAIIDDNLNAGYDISVTTRDGTVTLTGFVPSVEVQLQAVKLASEVEGVKLVSDKLNIRADKKITVKDYADDAVITAGIRAKLLTADNMPLTGISVETVDGIVQLSGSVKTPDQVLRAEQIAKQVDGVKTVKNDLSVMP